MPDPITYSERFYSTDGTEINVGVQRAVFHDATFANRLLGGFDSAQARIGRFVGLVDMAGLDADNNVVDVDSSMSDGSSSIALSVTATSTRRIAAVIIH